MWKLSPPEMFLIWCDVTRRFGQSGLERIEGLLLSLVGLDARNISGQFAEHFLMPDLPTRPWFDPVDFPWLHRLEDAVSQVDAGLLAHERLEHYLPRDGKPAVRRSEFVAPEEGWTAQFLCRDGEWRPQVCARFPALADVMRHLPIGPGDTMFSVMAPHSEIPMHVGLNNLCLTVHVGMEIPSACAIEVNGEQRGWVEGKSLVFDDTFPHRAYNASDRRRVVFLTDIWHPSLTPRERDSLLFMLPRLRRLSAPR